MNNFWKGFFKVAGGFDGVGKGNYHQQDSQNEMMGTVDTGVQDGKELLDRERNPSDFSPFNLGEPAKEDDSGTHVVY